MWRPASRRALTLGPSLRSRDRLDLQAAAFLFRFTFLLPTGE